MVKSARSTAPPLSSAFGFNFDSEDKGESYMRYTLKILYFTLAMLILSLLGCNNNIERSSSGVSFITKYAPIEFQFPSGWYVNKEDNPYDLQCFSKFQEMNTGVFVFKKIDVASDSTPLDILWTQVNDLKSKRRNFELLEDKQNYENDNRIFTTVTYIGDKDSSRYCYKFTLIEFKEDDSKFAVVLQIAMPGQWEKCKPILEKITQSARLLSAPE